MTLPFPLPDRPRFGPSPEFIERQADEPLVRVRLWDGSEAWLITRHADQRAVLTDPRFSSDNLVPGYPYLSAADTGWRGDRRVLINVDGDEHTAMRKPLQPYFTARATERIAPSIERFADELLDEMLAGPQPADFLTAFAQPLPALIMCELMAVPREDRARFQDFGSAVADPRISAEEAAAAMDWMSAYLPDLVASRQRHPDGDDIITSLLRAGHDPKYVVEQCTVLMAGGQETSANMLAFGLVILLGHPDQLAEFVTTEDPRVLGAAVDELVRYASVNRHGRRRVALADATVAGTLVRAGEGVIASTELANFDPAAFPDPFTFDIHRDARQQISFGHGRHLCLGRSLAESDIRIGLRTMFRRVPGIALGCAAEELEFDLDRVIIGFRRLPVVW